VDRRARRDALQRPLQLVAPVNAGLVFKAHRWLFSSSLGWRVIKKKAPAGRTYRGTLLIRKHTPQGPHRRTVPRGLWSTWEGGRFS
jgi:hypothetical protein